MFLKPEEKLSDQQIQSGLRWIVRDGVTTQAIVTFTSGAFLIAFALKLGASNFVIGLLAAIVPLAPILGGKFADFFAARQLDWTLKYTSPAREISFPTLNLQQWDFFFVLAFILGLYSLHRLSMVAEIGEVEEEIFMQELVTEVKLQVRTISSVAGLRHMVSLPVIILSRLMGKTEVNDAPID